MVAVLKNMKVNEKEYHGPLKMQYDEGRIFGFQIINNKVELQIIWLSYNPKPVDEVDFSTIEIECEKI